MNDQAKGDAGSVPEEGVASAADVVGAAETFISTWLAIEAALSPILGKRGVAALCQRSLYLIREDYPWLCDENIIHPLVIDFDWFKSVLSQQSEVVAKNASKALIKTFLDLLASLIGVSLTAQMLPFVWKDYADKTPFQGALL